MAAILAMTGPKEILELDGVKPGKWRLSTESKHLFQNQLWDWEVAGCILCAELDNAENQTLKRESDDGDEQFHCLCHGTLEKVDFSITRLCTVRIGGVEREFADVEEGHMFFPQDMDPEERDSITVRMIEETQQQQLAEEWLDDE